MKRLENCTFDGTLLKPNFFNSLTLNNKRSILYTWKQQNYEKMYLIRSEIILPYVDVYEIRAQHKTGYLCGYAFDIYCKNPTIEANFIIATSEMKPFSFTELKQNKNSLNLKYKLKGCNVYVMSSLATMLTISINPTIKNLLDI